MLRGNSDARVASANPDWMEPWCERFVEALRKQGYAKNTVLAYRLIARKICAAVRARGLDAASVGPAVVRDLCSQPPEGSSRQTLALWKGIAGRFLDYLAESGVIDLSEPEDLPPPDPLQRLGNEYEDWLRDQRGLRANTIRSHRSTFDRFMRFCFGEAEICPDRIKVPDIMAFLFPEEGCGSRPPDPSVASQLRSLLRFLHVTGRIREDLAWCIARVAHRRRSRPQTLLSMDDLKRVLDAVRDDTDRGRRDYAILLLTARLGLRAQEVVAIRLDDISWHQGEILIRGKGNFHDTMPLPVDVGEALADYIQHGRKGSSRQLFVSVNAPWQSLRATTTVTRLLRRAMRRAGLAPFPGPLGARMLRHSLATALLRRGAAFAEISDLLRHRHRATTMIYAKYDLDALRQVARPWPVLAEDGS